MSEVQTPEELTAALTSLREATQKWDADNGVVQDWPEQFSVRPVMGGNVSITVPQEEGDPNVYTVWLQRDEAGEFNQFVLLTPEHAQALMRQQAQPILNDINNNIHPVTKEQPEQLDGVYWLNTDAGPAGDYFPFNHVELPYDPETQTVVEPGALDGTGRAPGFVWVSNDENLQVGSVLTDEHFENDPIRNGYQQNRVTPSVLEDAQVRALEDSAYFYQSAAARAMRVEPVSVVSETAIEGTSALTVLQAPHGLIQPEPAPEDADPALVGEQGPDEVVTGQPEDAANPEDAVGLQEDFNVAARQLVAKLERQNVYFPDQLPTDQADMEKLMYDRAVRINNTVSGGILSPDAVDENGNNILDGLIAQYEDLPDGERYIEVLNNLKETPPQNQFSEIRGVRNSIVLGPTREAEVQAAPVPAADEPDPAPHLRNDQHITLRSGDDVYVVFELDGKHTLMTKEQLQETYGQAMDALSRNEPDVREKYNLGDIGTAMGRLDVVNAYEEQGQDAASFNIDDAKLQDLPLELQAALQRHNGHEEQANEIERLIEARQNAPENPREPEARGVDASVNHAAGMSA